MNSFILMTTGSFMGLELFQAENFLNLLIRFAFNLIVTVIIVRYIYYSKARRKDYLFTFLLINTIVFLLCILLSDVELKLGFAFGLFALFGILRYRTKQIPIKEMTYLFIVIGLSVINSIGSEQITYIEVIFSNLIVIGILWLLEFAFLLSHESSKSIMYEKVELIKEHKRAELLADLKERTGINIHRIEIQSLNFLRDTARITVYYYDKNRMINADEKDFDDDSDD